MAGDYYSRISARYWIDSKGWGERNQLVGLYLLTNTHSTMEGLYYLPIGYLCTDLGLTPKQASESLRGLTDVGLIEYDEDAEVVFVRKALKHSAPATDKHVIGAINRLRSVPDSPLWQEFVMACECHSNALAKAVRDAFPMACECHSNETRMAFESSVSNSRSNSSSKTALPAPDPPSDEDEHSEAPSVDPSIADFELQGIYDAWVQSTKRDPARTKLIGARRRQIRDALKAYGYDDCLLAVQNIGRSDWAGGNNDRGRAFNDIEHALGSGESNRTKRLEAWRDYQQPSALTVVNGNAPTDKVAARQARFADRAAAAARAYGGHTT